MEALAMTLTPVTLLTFLVPVCMVVAVSLNLSRRKQKDAAVEKADAEYQQSKTALAVLAISLAGIVIYVAAGGRFG